MKNLKITSMLLLLLSFMACKKDKAINEVKNIGTITTLGDKMDITEAVYTSSSKNYEKHIKNTTNIIVNNIGKL